MKAPLSLLALAIGCVGAPLLAAVPGGPASLARAQTASPAPAPAESRPDFSGTWSLDRSISTDLDKASFGASTDRNSQGANRRGGFGGFGGRGGFGGGSRSRNRDASSDDDSTADDRARLSALTDDMKKGFATLVISHHDPSFVVNDSRDHTQFFQTSGSSDEHQLITTKVTSTTHWEDSRLVTEYDLGNRKLVYTYALLPATRQMVLRIRLVPAGSQRATGAEVKLVYTAPPFKPETGVAQPSATQPPNAVQPPGATQPAGVAK